MKENTSRHAETRSQSLAFTDYVSAICFRRACSLVRWCKGGGFGVTIRTSHSTGELSALCGRSDQWYEACTFSASDKQYRGSRLAPLSGLVHICHGARKKGKRSLKNELDCIEHGRRNSMFYYASFLSYCSHSTWPEIFLLLSCAHHHL